MTKMSARQLSHVLANQGTRTTVAPIWPYVAADEYAGLRCYGDQHRESLQVGAVTPRDHAERTTRQATERAGKAESGRLIEWLTANAKSLPRVFMISDVVTMITADVFDTKSTLERQQLMIARALQRSGYRLINKQSKGGCWCREADFATVTKTTNGRMRLLEVPASLRPIRARAVALQKEWKDRRRGLARPVTGTLAAIEAPDAVHAYDEQTRIRMQRYRARKEADRTWHQRSRAAKKAEPASSRLAPIEPSTLGRSIRRSFPRKGIRATRQPAEFKRRWCKH